MNAIRRLRILAAATLAVSLLNACPDTLEGVSGHINYPPYSTGDFWLIVRDGEAMSTQTLAGGASVPYTLELEDQTGQRELLAILDHDLDDEITHFIDPCASRTVDLDEGDADGVDLDVQEGGCVEDITGQTPYEGFTHDKPWSAHFAYAAATGITCTVQLTGATGPVELSVHEDDDDDGRYDAGADTALCAPTASDSGAASCEATAAGSRLLILVAHGEENADFQTDFTLDVVQ